MELSYEDVQNILKIIDTSSLEELHLEIGDFKLVVRKKGASATAAEPPVTQMDDESAAVSSAEPVPASPEIAGKSVVAQGAKEVASVKPPSPSTPVRQGGHEVKAPVVGTFYRAPAPGAPPFVEVGRLVTEDDTVCIIEIMKLMNSIKAGCRGRVVEILVENGALVEFGQTLMVIEPLP